MEKKEELQKYLRDHINPMFEQLLTDILLAKPKPSHVVDFCKNWLDTYASNKKNGDGHSSEGSDNEDVAEVKPAPKAKGPQKARSAVSAEVYGHFNKKQDFVPPVIKKTEDVKSRILVRLKESFLFRNLDEKETDIVIDAMEEKNYKKGDSVITQGEDGDVLYVVDKGELDCFKKFTKDAEEKYLKTYVPGEAFGELALLYNAPRAATIRAKSDSTLFALDRATFNNIVKEAAEKRRKHYEEVLKKVDLLKEMDPYERNQIADVLKEMNVTPNEYIIKEGEQGNRFYIVTKGSFSATKKDHDGHEKVVRSYVEGDYFGELALLKDVPRQASVVSLTSGKLVYIERDAFKRVIGPVERILERNAEAYKKYKNI